MDPALLCTLAVLVVTVVLFFTEWIESGQTAMLAAAALIATGVLDAEQVFRGFSNQAVITVGAMFVVSAGVYRSGALNVVGEALSTLFARHALVGLGVLTLGVGVLSAFINNTTVVAIMLPLLLSASRELETSPSRYLMPLSYAAMLGGTCTLIVTSTNLIVSSFAEDEGLAPIGMFEMAPVGLAFFAAGVIYLLTLGRRLIPERRSPKALADSFEVAGYITDVALESGARAIGERLSEAPLIDDLDGDVLDLWRDGEPIGGIPHRDVVLEEGDVLRVRCAASDLPELIARSGAAVAPLAGAGTRSTSDVPLVEAVIGPRSSLRGQAIGDIPFRERYDAVVIAVRSRERLEQRRLDEIVLRAGDVVLLAIEKRSRGELERRGDFVLVSELATTRFRPERAGVAVGILVGVVGVAALGGLSIAAAAMIGAVLTLVTGCLRLDEAVEAVDWNVMMLLAGVFALGFAIESSGAAAIVSDASVGLLGDASPRIVVGAIYLGSLLVTSLVSNNATAALLTPIAIAIAGELEVDARPLVIAVAFGASTALITPVGYQTNTMVYGAGHYAFTDYLRAGAPLSLVLAVIASVLIPVVWPL